jgi:nitrogen-specific signal transduction histidine kinase
VSDGRETRADHERRLASAQRVAFAMLHEMRNVLNPIVSAAFLLDAHATDPVKVRELARRIEGFAMAEERITARMRELLEREAAGEDPAPATDIPSAPGSSPTTAQHP